MSKTSYHVIANINGSWKVKRADSDRAVERFDTREDAVNFVRRVSRNQDSELFIHGRDGRVEQKESFGSESVSREG